jgi:YidC/Oxa1 family membrane protein insertase
MFDTHNIFTAIFVIPILNVLVGVYKFLTILGIPGAFGFSLIVMTVIIRVILHPLMKTQLKSAHKMNKLKPQLDKLNQIYKNDKQRLHQEQLKLYQEAGINPAAGCLPLLLQMPILIALYNLFFQLLSNSNMGKVVEEINKVVYFTFLKINSLDLSFLGTNLAYKPSEWQKYGFLLLAIPIITALLQYWQTKLMVPPSTTKNLELTKNQQGEKKDEDMSTTMQKQMSFMMPLMIGFFAYSFPLGLSLYWNTFTIFGIIQQYQVNKQMEKETSQK